MSILSGLLEARHWREALIAILACLALLTVLALASYSPADPSFFASSPQPARNWIGPAGAQVSALLYELFGLTAWFIPLVLVAGALRQFKGGAERWRGSTLIGLVLVGIATGILLNLLVGRVQFRGAPLMSGGTVGDLLKRALVAGFSDIGSLVVAGTVLAIGLALAAHSSLSDVFADIWHTVRRFLPRPTFLIRGAQALGRGLAAVARWPARLIPWRRAAKRPARAVPHVRPPATPRSAAAPPAPAVPPAGTAAEPAPPAAPPAEAKPAPRRGSQARLPVEIPQPTAKLPPVELLSAASAQAPVDRQELVAIARQIEGRCAEFAVEGQVLEIHPGPVVTTFEYRPDAGVKLSRITALADDLALSLEAENVRIDRIPGRPTVGIEVPNRNRQLITLREVFEHDSFRKSPELLTIGLGKTQEGEVYCASLARMPHLLIAGSTGSGKSVGLNGIITSILYRARPDQVKFILIDPKMLELGLYANLPHLLVPVVTDMRLAANALKWGVREMERRYRLLASCNVRHLDGFNKMVEKEPEAVAKAIESIPRRSEKETFEAKKVPYIVIVVDELADLLITTDQETVEAIARLAQKARAVGIHLVLATQRPSVDVLDGTIKANFPARMAYRVASKIDSRTILDASGAERLLGAGDMLFRQPGSARLQRVHGAFVSEEESLRVVSWLRQQARAEYDKSILEEPAESSSEGEGGEAIGGEDPMYKQAVRLVVATGQGSTSFLQRRMRLGYSRAARIIDQMEQDGIVGPADGSRPRQILVDSDYLDRLDQQEEEET